jgi:RNA polymerase sigma-70 factor (ECF subfamily)
MQVADTCSAIDDQIADNEESNIIRSIIRNNLTDTQRKMAELRFIAQYSYDEIAAEMGLSMDNVKVTLHRAKRYCKKR